MISWFLTTPVQQSFGSGARFMAPRMGKDGARHHTGLDIKASEDDIVLAPESLTVVDGNRGWQGSAKATLCHTDSGFSLLLGCTTASPPDGTHLQAGEMVAKMGYYTKEDKSHSSHLHLQVYGKLMTPTQVNKAQSWYVGNPAPDGLVDPQAYLDDGVEPAPEDAPNNTPPGPAVFAEGGLTEAAPCPMVNGQMVCLLNQVTAWYVALLAYWDAGAQLLNLAIGLVDDGKLKWTPDANTASSMLDEAAALLTAHEEGKLPGLPNDQVKAFVIGCQRAQWAAAVLQAFNASAGVSLPPMKPSGSTGSGGGAGIVFGALALAGAGVTAAVYLSRRGKRRAA